MPSPFTIRDYKVGIVCALPLERTAIEAMLDEMHEPQFAIAGDNNVYSFGSIGSHNVVVASLGAGSYGTVSAAGVANDVRRSFPQLKYGLLVGIAGAIPRPESEDDEGDIRLGDVVVGCVNGVPSVINYKLGKERIDGFDIRSELSEPPEVLSRAVAALESQHQLNGPTYLIHLSNMLKKEPRLNRPRLRRDHYNMPDAPDRLFNAQSIYTPGEDDCKTSITSKDSEIVRQPRYLRDPPDALTSEKFIRFRDDGYADYPVVFRGSIGSADTLMESASRRDAIFHMVKTQRKAKLLCLEMAASGIVKGWPCLVIRGICDYCDSYNNDAWQNFAAATAAAYAKDLLLRIPPEKIEAARSVDELVDNASSHDSLMSNNGRRAIDNSFGNSDRLKHRQTWSGNRQIEQVERVAKTAGSAHAQQADEMTRSIQIEPSAGQDSEARPLLVMLLQKENSQLRASADNRSSNSDNSKVADGG